MCRTKPDLCFKKQTQRKLCTCHANWEPLIWKVVYCWPSVINIKSITNRPYNSTNIRDTRQPPNCLGTEAQRVAKHSPLSPEKHETRLHKMNESPQNLFSVCERKNEFIQVQYGTSHWMDTKHNCLIRDYDKDQNTQQNIINEENNKEYQNLGSIIVNKDKWQCSENGHGRKCLSLE